MKTPIYDFVSDYIAKNGARLHMPGHKGRIFLGAESRDITEICGADSLFNFDTWMEPERICQEAVLVVATRDHTPLKELDQQMQLLSQKYNGNFIRLDTMNIDVSSELLRSWHESGQSLRYYVPKPVISYIEKNDIYKGNDSDGKI